MCFSTNHDTFCHRAWLALTAGPREGMAVHVSTLRSTIASGSEACVTARMFASSACRKLRSLDSIAVVEKK